MSQVDAVTGMPVDNDVDIGGAPDPSSLDTEQLDEEATALLKELEESQLEVQRMLEAQRAQAEELGGMKDHLSSELLQLRDDTWKLHLFAELEMLKRQLAAINNLDADLDAMEAKLDGAEAGDGGDAPDADFQEALAAAQAGTRDLLSRLGGPATRGPKPSSAAADDVGAFTSVGNGSEAAGSAAGDGEEKKEAVEEDAEVEVAEDEEDVAALQDALDAELDAMMKQLQAIKAESAMVAARKAQLELELMALMRDEADDLTAQLRDLGIGEGQAEGQEAVEAEAGAQPTAATGQAEAAAGAPKAAASSP